MIWVYSGNPRYADAPTPIDSIVVIRAAIAALADAPVQVVLTTGYQDVPREFGALPANFHHAAYVPGPAMAAHCDLMVHHGGHSSVMTGLSAGTPAVIIPTITERESNARRLVALGAGEIVMPTGGANGEKHIDVAEFSAKVHRVLGRARLSQLGSPSRRIHAPIWRSTRGCQPNRAASRYASCVAYNLLSCCYSQPGAHRHEWPAGFRSVYRYRLFRRRDAEIEPQGLARLHGGSRRTSH